MRVVLVAHDGPDDEIDIDESLLQGRRVADLAAEIGGGRGAGLVIDGQWWRAEAPLAEVPLRRGSSIAAEADRPSPLRRQSSPSPNARTLAVTGGLRAGDRHCLAPGASVVIGRAGDCDIRLSDPTVSARHLAIVDRGELVAHDLGSTNGSELAGSHIAEPTSIAEGSTLRLGSTRLTVRREPDDTPHGLRVGLGARDGTVPFNRSPRVKPVDDLTGLDVPAAPAPLAAPEPLSWVGVALPAVAGAAVAILFSWLYAVFAALGAVLTVGTWFERNRRHRRDRRRGERALAAELDALRAELPDLLAEAHKRFCERHPDLAEVARRAAAPSTRLWERRPGDVDWLRVAAGIGEFAWRPALRCQGHAPAPEAVALVAEHGMLRAVPVEVELGEHKILGVIGSGEAAASVIRGLIAQIAVHHGPGDLAIAGFGPGFDWMRWLPHAADVARGTDSALVATSREAAAAVADAVEADPTGRHQLVVIGATSWIATRDDPARRAIAGGTRSVIVAAGSISELPAGCTAIVEAHGPIGLGSVVDPRSTASTPSVALWGMSHETARSIARALARLDDPELDLPSAHLPDRAALVDLIPDAVDGEALAARWTAATPTQLPAVIGADRDGPVTIDLVTDGPHVLVGGMTGSGKSELLRGLVASLALTAGPDRLAFVLIDYKGGAAFDRCADLPHVAGLVTDLDDHLGERALRCLEAEIRRREQWLRRIGADDVARVEELTGDPPSADGDLPPRLVIVIDEYATLAGDLPDFLDALVSIAARGRSLGMHLVLATQRPAGSVTEDIRANTGVRVSLRVADRHDSIDVIGVADAADLPRDRPGRGWIRRGPGDLLAFQAALVTGRTPQQRRLVHSSGPVASEGPTDLERIVEVALEVHARSAAPTPASPWPPPLPESVEPAEIVKRSARTAAAWLIDDPDHQRIDVGGWSPADGHLVVLGQPGSGTSTTLRAVALDCARRFGPDALHLHGIDMNRGELTRLDPLPHAGTLVAPADDERRTRLLRLVAGEVAQRRREDHGPRPDLVLVVDDLGGLDRAHDPVRHRDVHAHLEQIWADGPAVGVHMAVSIRRAADLRPDLAATAGVILLHRSDDPADALRFGLRCRTSTFVAGRAVDSRDGRELHVGRCHDEAAAVAQVSAIWAAPVDAALRVGTLESVVSAASVPVARRDGHQWCEFDIGIDELTLGPATIRLHGDDPFVVLGSARSGRTSALHGIASLCRGEPIVVAATATELSERLGVAPTDASELRSRLAEAAATAVPGARSTVLVDDAERVDDVDEVLAALAEGSLAGVRLVAAARLDRLRSGYGHWSQRLREARSGLVLRPGPLDLELLGASVPSRLEVAAVVGRGLLIADAQARVVQVAMPPPP